MMEPLDRTDVVGEVLGEIRAASTIYAPSGDSGGSRGGSETENGAIFVAPLTNSPRTFTCFRRAGYEIRTHDLQLGKLTLYR
jgi:hypothetical protein